MAVVEAAGDRIGPHVTRIRPVRARLVVEDGELRLLRRADAAVGIQDDDPRVGDGMKRVCDGAAGVAGGRDQDGERLLLHVERRHQPRHHPRADVFEGEGRPVKELQRMNARLDFHERNRKVERGRDDRLVHRGVDFAARERAQRPHAGFGQRAVLQPRQLTPGPWLDRLGHVEAAVGSEPFEECGLERNRRRLTSRRDKTHLNGPSQLKAYGLPRAFAQRLRAATTERPAAGFEQPRR
jgi:hypothetical protein